MKVCHCEVQCKAAFCLQDAPKKNLSKFLWFVWRSRAAQHSKWIWSSQREPGFLLPRLACLCGTLLNGDASIRICSLKLASDASLFPLFDNFSGKFRFGKAFWPTLLFFGNISSDHFFAVVIKSCCRLPISKAYSMEKHWIWFTVIISICGNVWKITVVFILLFCWY